MKETINTPKLHNMRVLNKISSISRVVSQRNLDGDCVNLNILGKNNTYGISIAKSKELHDEYEFDHLFSMKKNEHGEVELTVFGYKPDEFKKTFTTLEDIETYLDGVIATIQDSDAVNDKEVIKGYIAFTSTNGVVYDVDIYDSQLTAEATAVAIANQSDYKDEEGKTVSFENYQELQEYSKLYLMEAGKQIFVKEATIHTHEVRKDAKERFDALIHGNDYQSEMAEKEANPYEDMAKELEELRGGDSDAVDSTEDYWGSTSIETQKQIDKNVDEAFEQMQKQPNTNTRKNR